MARVALEEKPKQEPIKPGDLDDEMINNLLAHELIPMSKALSWFGLSATMLDGV
jgi:hypothetical protein